MISRYLCALFWLLVAFFATMSTSHAGERFALIIGNGAYQNVTRLTNPANDAADLAKKLEGMGFSVELQTDLGKAALEGAVADFADRAAAAEIALVFFAGHGLEVDRQNYLIPVDAKLASDRRLPVEAVSLDTVLGLLDGVAGLKLVLIDACRNNPFSATMRMTKANRSVGRGLSRVEADNGTLISFAAKEGTVAADGDGRNSPFTAALLDHLGEPGVEINFLFRKVRDSVISATNGQQEPYLSASLPSEAIYLVPPTPAPAAPEAAPVAEVATPTVVEPATDTAAIEVSFWESIRDSDDVAVFDAYLAKYPNGAFAPIAAIRRDKLKAAAEKAQTEVASLPSGLAPAEAATPVTRETVLALQTELNRIGCSTQKPDGAWGNVSRDALTAFSQATGVKLASLEPDPAILDMLRAREGRVCPLACGSREVEKGGKCVAKTCRKGETLDRNGRCVVETAIVKPAKPADEIKIAKPAAGESRLACRRRVSKECQSKVWMGSQYWFLYCEKKVAETCR